MKYKVLKVFPLGEMSICKLTIRILKTKTSTYLPSLSQFPWAVHCGNGQKFMSENRTGSQKSTKTVTGKELDVAREGPYAGLTRAQKGCTCLTVYYVQYNLIVRLLLETSSMQHSLQQYLIQVF